MVVPEQATESFTANDLTRDGTDLVFRFDEVVAQSLVVALRVVVLQVLLNCEGSVAGSQCRLQFDIVHPLSRSAISTSNEWKIFAVTVLSDVVVWRRVIHPLYSAMS